MKQESKKLAAPVSAEDHAWGPTEAPVTLVVYSDYQCPHCAQAWWAIKEIKETLGDGLRVVYRHFPLSKIHPRAAAAAAAALAAEAQGRFWEMHDVIMANQTALGDEDLLGYAAQLGLDTARFSRELADRTYARRVLDDQRSGVRSGVTGTPALFVNNRPYDGRWDDTVELAKHLTAMVALRAEPL